MAYTQPLRTAISDPACVCCNISTQGLTLGCRAGKGAGDPAEYEGPKAQEVKEGMFDLNEQTE